MAAGSLPGLVALAAGLLAAGASAPARADDDETSPPDQPSITGKIEGWHWAGVPVVSYGSDVGLTLGGALFVYAPFSERPSEQRHSITVSLSYATRGPKSLDGGWTAKRLLGTSLSTMLNLHLSDDGQMPYWGEGAQLGGLSTPPGFGSPPEPYRYHDRRAFLAAVARALVAGPFGWHVRARYLNVGVPEQSALLASSSPPGARGGRVALFEAGLLWDSRDRDMGTHRGVFANLAAFAAPAIGGVSDFGFHGWDASVRVYVPLVLGATLAMRGVWDVKRAGIPWQSAAPTDAVPFFERMLYEGISYNEGLGGGGTIRGVARYRISGEDKLLGNVQLRIPLFTVHPAGKPLEFGLSAGVDAGRASQPGYDAVQDAGAAVGLRLAWDRAILARFEVGRARGGDNTFFVGFGEMF
ncbi:MAG TPA: BamA/TamA family outer membrane protein [Anaeromyxobacteraceae bacterium]|nr:BamA/TamA family outer membrane protein [Anaeromyxobacteraceae bacterium]